MVATAADNHGEDSGSAFDDEDNAWLVRQFGRYLPLLKGDAGRTGGPVSLAADFSLLVGARALPAQEHVQTRRLLQLSNRQHQERLQNMQQSSAAYAQRLRQRTRGQKRKRARGCEHGAESSSSSSSSEEDAKENEGAASRLEAEREETERQRKPADIAGQPTVSEDSLGLSKEEINPLLFAAYDLITCPNGSAGGPPAELPSSLLAFLNSQEQPKPRGAPGSLRQPEADRPGDAAKAGVLHATRTPVAESDAAEASGADQKAFEAVQPAGVDEPDFHPIRQLQESVMHLPEQNKATKERLMREQLRLLALRWKCLLLSGCNILVAGCGSKTKLLREFASLALHDGFCCIMNAYRREFKLQHALQAVVQVVRNHLGSHSKAKAAVSATIMIAQAAGGASASCIRLVKELKALLQHVPHLLYLVILGLDSSALVDARRHLAALTSCDKVRLICSADHIQHAVLVDTAELRDFRFVFETVHTRRDYREEVLSRWGAMCGFVPGWLWTASRVTAAGTGGSSVNFAIVLRGLTTNHKRLLRGIAELQLAQLQRNESPIVSLADLGSETSGVSLSLSKLKLKELLIEVTSHGAAVYAKKNGQDAVAIRANKLQLQELLELLEKTGV
ncbi:hypothetical protein Efla_005912 [Eimeria flavescens]